MAHKLQKSKSKIALEFLLGYGEGLVEHSLIFPTALRKDFTNDNDYKAWKWGRNAHKIGYVMSFVPLAFGPVVANYLMYKGLSHNASELLYPVMGAQIGLNVISALYEVSKLVKNNKKQKSKRGLKLNHK